MKHCNIEQIEMRLIQTIISLAIIAIAAMGCEKEAAPQYVVAVNSEVICSCDEQVVEIQYTVDERYRGKVSATADYTANWIEAIDTTEPNIIRVSVMENLGDDSRTTDITLNVAGHSPQTLRFMQYGVPPTEATHTLMYIFLGTSLSRYYDTNIEDAKKAIEIGILGNSNRILYFRQKSKNIGYINEIYYDFAKGKCAERNIVEEISMNAYESMTMQFSQILSKMANEAPAKRYGLVLGGHGQGWITREILAGTSSVSALSSPLEGDVWVPAADAEVTRAYGEDNVRMDITELSEGITSSGVELDYILFDACFMSNIEAIYDLRDCANYIIASPCEIMGKGFPYERTLPYLFVDGGNRSDYIMAAESYYLYYRDEYTSSYRCGSIAVIDCNEVAALAEATAEVVATAKSEYDASKLQTYEGQRTHHFYDFGQWTNVVATDSEALGRYNDQLARCIIAKYTLPIFYSAYGTYGTYSINEEVYSGITTSAPSQAYPKWWKETNWYKSVWKQ